MIKWMDSHFEAARSSFLRPIGMDVVCAVRTVLRRCLECNRVHEYVESRPLSAL